MTAKYPHPLKRYFESPPASFGGRPMIAVEYPHLEQQKLFYVSPTAMRWRSTFGERGIWSKWFSGAEYEPPWFAAGTYEVEPVPTAGDE